MEAAFVEVGLEKNGFLYVDEIVGPELERGHGRKIQDLISKGQTILVQAVKDPMKTKGARLTTQISLPGRFVVFVPQGEGLGVSRRLDDDERLRLKEILKKLSVKEGGVIVRTAAEGASEEDIERDLVFLQRVWRSIQAQANTATAPELVYQEAELPLRVTRDLFTGDFVKAYVDNDQAFKRITGYLKKTSPHMVERVVRYKEKAPLMEHFGVEQEIKSTLSRRVDLPSGGYLIFDYAEAFTVIDVNTGRFVGDGGRAAGARTAGGLPLAGLPDRARGAHRGCARRAGREAAARARVDDKAEVLPRGQAGHASRSLRRARRGEAFRSGADGAGRRRSRADARPR